MRQNIDHGCKMYFVKYTVLEFVWTDVMSHSGRSFISTSTLLSLTHYYYLHPASTVNTFINIIMIDKQYNLINIQLLITSREYFVYHPVSIF